jgi:Dolichyl-phosphate-mannose-protein mannosyltransferase
MTRCCEKDIGETILLVGPGAPPTSRGTWEGATRQNQNDRGCGSRGVLKTSLLGIDRRHQRYLLAGFLLLAAWPLSRLDPTSGSHAGTARPLNANFVLSVRPMIVIPILLIVGFCFAIPSLFKLEVKRFLAVLVVAGSVFALTSAGKAGGLHAVTGPFAVAGNYWSQVPVVERLGPRAFDVAYPHLFRFIYPLSHAATHPPGALLLLWAMSRLTGGDIRIVCLLVTLIGCLGAVPTYFVAREEYGETTARAAALLFVCCPGILIYSAATMDAVFVTLTAVTLVAAVRAPRSSAWALGAGALFTLAVCFTFAAFILVPVLSGIGILALMKHAARTIALRGLMFLAGAIGGMLILRIVLSIDLIPIFRSVAQAQAHFDKFSGRHYRYWVWADVAAFLFSAGLGHTALWVGEIGARWRDRRLGLETVLLVTLVLCAVSGLFRGETDRIWLVFVPLLCATGAASARQREIGWVAAAGLTQVVAMQFLLVLYR